MRLERVVAWIIAVGRRGRPAQEVGAVEPEARPGEAGRSIGCARGGTDQPILPSIDPASGRTRAPTRSRVPRRERRLARPQCAWGRRARRATRSGGVVASARHAERGGGPGGTEPATRRILDAPGPRRAGSCVAPGPATRRDLRAEDGTRRGRGAWNAAASSLCPPRRPPGADDARRVRRAGRSPRSRARARPRRSAPGGTACCPASARAGARASRPRARSRRWA